MSLIGWWPVFRCSSEATASRGRFTMCRVDGERNREGGREGEIVWKGLEKRGSETETEMVAEEGEERERLEWRERRGWKGGESRGGRGGGRKEKDGECLSWR